jgi:hypothetical protein
MTVRPSFCLEAPKKASGGCSGDNAAEWHAPLKGNEYAAPIAHCLVSSPQLGSFSPDREAERAQLCAEHGKMNVDEQRRTRG